MDENSIRHLLTSLKVPHHKATYTGSRQRTRWLSISCPFAPWTHAKKTDENPSFGITIQDDGFSSYKCLSCGLKGRLSALPTRLGGYRKLDYTKLRMWAQSVELNASLFKPVPKWEDADPVAIDYSDKTSNRALPSPSDICNFPLALGHPYLRKRGLAYADIMRMNIRLDRYQKRVLFPVYDHEDNFCGLTGRSTRNLKKWTKEIPKVKDYFGLNKREVFLKLKGRHPGIKLIGEGLFDYATFVRFGYHNARAILGTALTPEKVDILASEAEPVHFFMDNDLAGWQATFGTLNQDGQLETENAWAFRLYKEIPVWIVPYKTHLGGEDPGSIKDKETLDNMVKRAWLFTGKAPLTKAGLPTFVRPKLW